MSWDQAKDLVIGFLASGFCIVLVNKLQKLCDLVEALNEKLAIVVVRVDFHEKRLEKIEDKIA